MISTRRAAFQALRRLAKFSHVDLDFVDGCFVPGPHGWTTGPDEFELRLQHLGLQRPSVAAQRLYAALKARWLPYYGEELRCERLAMVRRFCFNNLEHIPPYVDRGLYFQAFNRLYDAFREFLQALFIARRTYPIAYDKWIREQIEEILVCPTSTGNCPGCSRSTALKARHRRPGREPLASR